MKTHGVLRQTLLTVMFLFFPITIFYFSPILPLEGAARGILAGSVVVFALQFASALVVGRLFCGWLCPAGGLQEIVSMFREKRVERKRINWIKYLVWIPWFGLFIVLVVSSGGIKQVDFFWQTDHGISVSNVPSLIIYLIVVFVFFALAVVIGKRAACHTICWMAPFMIWGRKVRNVVAWPSLKLQVENDRCTQCRRCSTACPMSIDVMALVQTGSMENADCILCGNCIRGCPQSVIRYGFGSGI